MKSLLEFIKEAEVRGVAIGHFNISDSEGFHAVVGAAKKLNVPVIIGVSEGERSFLGVHEAVALVKSFREKENFPVFLNADHSYSFEKVKEAVLAGFDAVIYDGARLSLEENIRETRKCVEYAKSKNPDILVEGEVGYIGMSSKLLDEIPEGVSLENLTTPEEASKFVQETGVDLFAPAVGNIHGMLRNAKEPRLNISRIKDIKDAVEIPLVLHGGSGTSDEDFLMAIEGGISIIHINTEIRLAYREALKETLREEGEEIAPYKIMKHSVEEMEKVVEKRLRLFSKIR